MLGKALSECSPLGSARLGKVKASKPSAGEGQRAYLFLSRQTPEPDTQFPKAAPFGGQPPEKKYRERCDSSVMLELAFQCSVKGFAF